MMARLVIDGFDWPLVANNFLQRWSSQTQIGVGTTSPAFGNGGYLTTGVFPNLQRNGWGSNEQVVYGALRIRRTAAGGSGILAFNLRDSTTTQIALSFETEGTVTVRNASGIITQIGGAAKWNVWESYQFRVFIHNTDGTFEVRKNGSSTPIISLTNINTRAGTANAYVNGLQINNANNTSAIWNIDDLILWSESGDAPNSWLGDVRIYTSTPTAPGSSSQFTLATPTTDFGQTTALTTGALATNTTRYQQIVASYTGSVVQANIRINAGITGTLAVALYDATGRNGQPGTRIAEATPQVDPMAGTISLGFVSPVSVIRGSTYYVAIQASTSVVLNLGFIAYQYSLTTPYGTFAADVSKAIMLYNSGTNQPFVTLTMNHTNSSANSDVYDNDSTTVESSTVGHTDLYSMATLPSSPTAIIGVEPFVQARRLDAGAITVGTRLQSGATGTTVASTASAGSVTSGHAFVSAFRHVDPNTAGAWSQSSVNAIQVGPTIVA